MASLDSLFVVMLRDELAEDKHTPSVRPRRHFVQRRRVGQPPQVAEHTVLTSNTVRISNCHKVKGSHNKATVDCGGDLRRVVSVARSKPDLPKRCSNVQAELGRGRQHELRPKHHRDGEQDEDSPRHPVILEELGGCADRHTAQAL